MKRKCCCGEAYPCESDCSSGVPDTLSVSISGAADDQCSNWADLDGSYTIDYQACTRWAATFSTPVDVQMYYNSTWGCIGTIGTPYWTYRIDVSVEFNGTDLVGIVSVVGEVNISGTIIPLWESHTFKATGLSLPVDCCLWTAYDLPYDSRSKGANNADYGGDLSQGSFNITSSVPGCGP